jgi:hypothetical protein
MVLGSARKQMACTEGKKASRNEHYRDEDETSTIWDAKLRI